MLRTDHRRRSFSSTLFAGLPLLLLQTKENKPAKSITAEEFNHFMLVLVFVVRRMLADTGMQQRWAERTGGSPDAGGTTPILSYDNPSIHGSPVLQDLFKSTYFTRFPLPPKSPDVHRIIERVHGRICNRFRKWLLRTPGQRTMRDYVGKLQNIFATKETGDVIYADVCSYDLMLNNIIAKEGSWAERRYR